MNQMSSVAVCGKGVSGQEHGGAAQTQQAVKLSPVSQWSGSDQCPVGHGGAGPRAGAVKECQGLAPQEMKSSACKSE